MTEFIYWHFKRPMQHFPYWIAARMPRWLVYHCAIRLIAHATTGKYGAQLVCDLKAMESLARWEGK